MDASVIIIPSEDDDSEYEDSISQRSTDDPSVLIVDTDEVKNGVPDQTLSPSKLNEDLVITFSRQAEVLPHARYDCTVHPFTPTDREIRAPVGSNQLICDQCYCFVCDKLASKCNVWCAEGVCHCNSHKRSLFWSSLRNSVVLGYLRSFNLQLLDVDSHLRHADSLLKIFRAELRMEYSKFLIGKAASALESGLGKPNQGQLLHDYSGVFECVSSFLNQADQQEDRAAAIMRLGAAQDFITHFQPPGVVINNSAKANATEAKSMLLQRVIDSVQKQMVMANFTTDFIRKLQTFYQKLSLPPLLRSLRNSLCVRPWDDVLLVSVLRGQNVTGVRKEKGKRDLLVEPTAVVLLRAELLQQQHRYRELSRYLRVVETDISTRVTELRDLVPLFLCKAGQFPSAISTFFPSLPGPASRLSPQLFPLYLRIFNTATAPMVTTSLPTEPVPSDAKWEPIEGAVPLTRAELVKFAHRLLRACPAVYNDSQCWTYLLELVITPSDSHIPLTEPNPTFLNDVRMVCRQTLANKLGSNIPRVLTSVNEHQDQALLLFVMEALAQRILHSPLRPALPVILTFKENVWCFQYLCDSLASSPDVFHYFLQGVQQELENTEGVSENLRKLLQPMFGFLRTGVSENLRKLLQPMFGFLRTVRKIWIMGCSHISRGEERAAILFGKSFGFNAIVSWYGEEYHCWRDLLPRFYAELSTQSPPDILLLHAGGDDLRRITSLELVGQMQQDLLQLHGDFPAMRIVYSCISERCNWRVSDPGKINRARMFVNNVMRDFVIGLGGASIDHPQIKHNCPGQFLLDGVNFTPLGNDIFLSRLHFGLKRICEDP